MHLLECELLNFQIVWLLPRRRFENPCENLCESRFFCSINQRTDPPKPRKARNLPCQELAHSTRQQGHLGITSRVSSRSQDKVMAILPLVNIANCLSSTTLSHDQGSGYYPAPNLLRDGPCRRRRCRHVKELLTKSTSIVQCDGGQWIILFLFMNRERALLRQRPHLAFKMLAIR